jgi:hypothetical protein
MQKRVTLLILKIYLTTSQSHETLPFGLTEDESDSLKLKAES